MVKLYLKEVSFFEKFFILVTYVRMTFNNLTKNSCWELEIKFTFVSKTFYKLVS